MPPPKVCSDRARDHAYRLVTAGDALLMRSVNSHLTHNSKAMQDALPMWLESTLQQIREGDARLWFTSGCGASGCRYGFNYYREKTRL